MEPALWNETVKLLKKVRPIGEHEIAVWEKLKSRENSAEVSQPPERRVRILKRGLTTVGRQQKRARSNFHGAGQICEAKSCLRPYSKRRV